MLDTRDFPIVELRQYTLRPGRRDDLIELFDREFVESQEDTGIRVIGQFRDLDDPDRFVWLRGFADMASRAGALQAFYGGPVWAAHRERANDTMIDSDNVLLLRQHAPFPPLPVERPGVESEPLPAGLVVVTVAPLPTGTGAEFATFFHSTIAETLAECGGAPVATLLSEHSPNTFPALPVREDAEVFVAVAIFAAADEHARYAERVAATTVPSDTAAWLADRPQVLRLRPTSRSLLPCREPDLVPATVR